MREADFFLVEIKFETVGKRLLRKRLRRRRRKMHIEELVELRRGKPFSRIFVREDDRAELMHRGVAIGVVKMPVSVDQYFERCIADSIERLLELGRDARKTCVHQDLS